MPLLLAFAFIAGFATAIFAASMWITVRRGTTDPVCGMKVDRAKAIRKDFGGETFYFCSEHCLHAFELDPDRYSGERADTGEDVPAHAQ